MHIVLRNPIAFVVGNWRFLKIVRKFRPTNIHAYNPLYILSFLPGLLLVRMPMVYRAGDVPIRHRRIWRLLWRFITWRTQHFVAVSGFIAREIESTGVQADRIEVIYGTPPKRPDQGEAPAFPPADPAVPDIVFLGQIVKNKGIHLLIHAFRTLVEDFPQGRLLIVGRISEWRGDDWARDLRDSVAHDPVLSSRVVFTGFVENVPVLLQGRTVLVAPTLTEEPLGLVVMEAKAAGLPSVVFPSGGLPEMIEHGVDGFICRDKSVEALTEALNLYLTDPIADAASRGSRKGFSATSRRGRFLGSMARCVREDNLVPPQIATARHPAINRRTSLSPLMIVFAVFATIISPNPIMALASFAVLAFIWIGAFTTPIRTIMAAFISFQWLQATMQVWLAEFYRIDLSLPQVATICNACRPLSSIVVTATTEDVTLLSLAGIALLTLGTRVLEPRILLFRPSVTEFQPSRLFLGYLLLLAVDRIATPFTGGGLAQPLIVLGTLRFAFAIMLLYVWVTTRRGLMPLLGVVAIEVLIGFTGFFSNFKTIFIVAGVASLTIANLHWSRIRPICWSLVPFCWCLPRFGP